MADLSVIPPHDYVGAMESVGEVITMVQQLLDAGAAYVVDDPDYPDIYASITATDRFGYESNYPRQRMLELFAERGGDPDRPGKRDPLDALLWRAAREGEPAWDAPFGAGRPGWHVECSAIATNRLGSSFAIQGGGSDLIFPHHEFSAAHAEAALASPRMAEHYVHTGMISLDGVKMSKSLGNLVFVSKLTEAGHDPSAIRLGVYLGHYRSDRDWSDKVLWAAEHRLVYWRMATTLASDEAAARALVQQIRSLLADDLNTPAAIKAIDEWADSCNAPAADPGDAITPAGSIVATAVDALMGVKIS
jgi:cysteine--1-D-myo-inosityl 2-amino-2-deoxy-alpha-D-glucopyranoside ligase